MIYNYYMYISIKIESYNILKTGNVYAWFNDFISNKERKVLSWHQILAFSCDIYPNSIFL